MSGAYVRTISAMGGRLPARRTIADVAFDKAKPPARALAHRRVDLIEVALIPGREIVEADDVLPGLEERLDNVRADKPRRAGNEPAARAGAQMIGNRGGKKLAHLDSAKGVRARLS